MSNCLDGCRYWKNPYCTRDLFLTNILYETTIIPRKCEKYKPAECNEIKESMLKKGKANVKRKARQFK